jgi:hypothetical protein
MCILQNLQQPAIDLLAPFWHPSTSQRFVYVTLGLILGLKDALFATTPPREQFAFWPWDSTPEWEE